MQSFKRLRNIWGRLRYGRHYQFYMQKDKGLVYQRFLPWFKARGDETLRLNYNLNRESVIFDLGGYRGDWAHEMDRRYHCFIYIFEPVFEFSKGISERFKNNSNIKVFSWGLSDQDKKTFLTLSDDGSSEFKTTKDSIEIDLVQASRFLKEQNISRIDLMKINIEGGEYDLLEHLIAQGWITRITNLQIQFHDFVPKAKERMLKIQQNLKKTHSLTYHFEFVWENWRLKESV